MFFVESNESDTSYKEIDQADFSDYKSTPEKPIKYLQQIFFLIDKDRSRLTEYFDDDLTPYTITVYLGKGTHFFYTCNLAEGTTSCGEAFCNKQIEHYYQLTDNIVFHFKPLRSDSMTNAELQKLYTDVGATYNAISS